MAALYQHQRNLLPVANAPRERPGSQGGKTSNSSRDDRALPASTGDVKMVHHALKYAELGWKVFPVAPGGKKPLIPKSQGGTGFKDATDDPEQIREWWDKYPDANIGLATGKESGVLVLDFDLYKDPDTLISFQESFGALPETYVQESPRGGRHYFFRYNGFEFVKSCASRLYPNVDIRGDSGYIIMAPSTFEGKPYEKLSGTPKDIANVPPKVFEAIVDISKRPEKALRKGTPGEFTGKNTPYGHKAMLNEICILQSTPEGQRNDQLNKSAFALGQLIAGGEIDVIEATIMLTNTARDIGLESREIQNTLKSGIEAGKRQLRTSQQAQDEWPEIVPLNDSKAPNIPDNIIPGWAGYFTREAARAIQIPYPMALASVLGTLSLTVSSTVKCIHVRPGYVETLNLYLFAPLLSGERKTSMVGTATAPLYEWETEQAELKSSERQAALSRRKTQEKIIEGMRNRAAKTRDNEERIALINSITEQEAALEDVPSLPRLLADDATPESLPRILKAQSEILGIISSEGGIFDIFGGRYSRDGIPNLDLLLKAHNGEPYRVDRIGRDPIVLSNPRLVVCICPQPDVLLSMADKPGFRGRGLLARFLYFFSESQVGKRDISPAPIPESVAREYSTRIKALLDMRGANLALTISPAAMDLWLEFAKTVEEQMRPGGEFEHFRDWAGKLPGQAARLAGVIHCIEASLPSVLVISEDTMRRALSLAALLADHAKVAFSTMRGDPATEAARAVLDWIQRKRKEKFSLRECFRDLDGRYKSTSEIKPGLSVLIERGYIKDIGMEQTGGRPRGPYFLVNPSVLGGNK